MEHFGGSSSEFNALTHLLTASIAACLGYIGGGVMAVAKFSDLHLRLETAEHDLATHVKTVADLTGVLRLLLNDIEQHGISPAMQQAKQVLSAL